MGRPTACCLLVYFRSASDGQRGSHLKDRACPVCLTGTARLAGGAPVSPVPLWVWARANPLSLLKTSLVCSAWENEAIVDISSSEILTLQSVWNTGSVGVYLKRPRLRIRMWWIWATLWTQRQPLKKSNLSAAKRDIGEPAESNLCLFV